MLIRKAAQNTFERKGACEDFDEINIIYGWALIQKKFFLLHFKGSVANESYVFYDIVEVEIFEFKNE